MGIAADDFQQPMFGQPFTVSINGMANSALIAQLNLFDQTGPQTQFFTIGIEPSTLLSTHILTLQIDEGGNGGDGWAIDFLTIGVVTQPIPEPSSAHWRRWRQHHLFLVLGGVGVVASGATA